jgi:hypothetical protein
MNSLIVEGFADFGPYCLHFPSTVGGICSSELKQRLQHTTGLPVDVQRLKFNSRYLQDSDEIPLGSSSSPSSTTVIHLTLSLNGGKGGFGANLKRLGGRMSRKGATNYEACRDLNGRRLRTLHDAQKYVYG